MNIKTVITLFYLGMMLCVSSCYTEYEKVTEKTIARHTDKLTIYADIRGCDDVFYKIATDIKTINNLQDSTIANSSVIASIDIK